MFLIDGNAAGPAGLQSSRDTSSRRSSQQAATSPRADSPQQGTSRQEDRTSQEPQEPIRPLSPQPGPSSAPDEPLRLADSDLATSSHEDMELDEEILKLLGEAPKPDTALGKSIHKDIASRWHEILNKGLQKDLKEKLSQEYLVPSNCESLVPPILNPEAKAALPEALVKRDASLMQRQKQIGLALSALAQAADLIIKKKSSTQDVLKPISDACRLLCDSHFLETKMRRIFVISAINTNLKDALINTERDKFLFGDNISEKLKTAQTVQKSGNSLKNTQNQYNQFNKTNFTMKNKQQKGHLNYKNLHHKPPNQTKSDAARRRAAQPATRYGARYRAKERSRSPPPPPRRSYRK